IYERQDLSRVQGDKVWGLFAEKSIPYYVDRTNEPSLAQMTESALRLLSNNKNGFFLMVEGSKADWASHANLPVAMVGDLKDFDEAVGSALKFAQSNKDTLVIVAADHATGGMSIGHRDLKEYASPPLGSFVHHLRSVKISEENLAQQIFKDRNSTKMLLKQYLNLDANHPLVKKVEQQKTEERIQTTIAQWNTKLANLAWTTGGHTGEDVALYVYASDPRYQLTGTILNSDIARYVEKAFNGNLDQLTETLFVPSSSFARQGITLKTALSDKSASQFTLSKNNQEYTFYKNRNYFDKNGQKTEFSGVVVYNGKELFIPQTALNLL
ncbi:MAG: alkaline phosphatase, partial [Enterobacteriaceae bacterium]